MRTIILICALSLVMVGCNSKKGSPTQAQNPEIQVLQADYKAALENATNAIPYAADFARLFPKAQCGFSYYIRGAGPTSFYMKADLYGKYELTMQLPRISFDASRRKVTGFGEPEFILLEVAEVKKIIKVGSRGAVTNWSGSYNENGRRRFGTNEWGKIVRAKGDFSAIGYTFVTNAPVPGFREFRGNQINQ